MAIELLDDERQEDSNEEYASFDEVVEQEAPEEVQEDQPEDELPEKYQGKTAAEIAKMHQEAEKALGRQGGEVGELRKIVDDFVKAQLTTKTAPVQQEAEETIDEDDWYLNPHKAVEKAISNHPKLKQAEAMTLQMQQAKAVETLKNQHPDFGDIIKDEGFREWVMKSKIRQQLLAQADQNYDVDAADELLSTWKERVGAVKNVAEGERVERKKQVKAASTGNATGSGEAPSRKIYRRADIIKLMQTDPDRYMELAEDIAQAYAEKRVK